MLPLVSSRPVGVSWHTKHYNIQWYLLPNNSSSEYRTSPKPWHAVYILLLYDISISWLNLLSGKPFYFFTWVTRKPLIHLYLIKTVIFYLFMSPFQNFKVIQNKTNHKANYPFCIKKRCVKDPKLYNNGQ